MISAALSLFSVGYQLGPPALQSRGARVSACTMEEYRLNNYILPGPVKPVGNQVLVKMRKLEEKTGGGLFVPTADTEKPKEGIVVASGPGRVNAESGELIPNPVSEGDLVLLSDFTGEKVEYNGEKHIFVEADGLLGKFEGGKVTASSFTPIADRVLVAVAEAEKETSTGIALALDDDDDEFAGEVVAVGAGKYLTNGQQKAVDITTGNNVMYKRHTGHNAKMDGKSFKIVFENDCIAKW